MSKNLKLKNKGRSEIFIGKKAGAIYRRSAGEGIRPKKALARLFRAKGRTGEAIRHLAGLRA